MTTQETLKAVQALSGTVGILQATTAVIGVGVVATAALSAVNLWQTLKLRQDVSALRLEVKEGFIDLKQLLQNQGSDLIEHLDRVAADVDFRNHRTILSRAYGLFTQANIRLQSALTLQDPTLRNAEINASRDMMFQALADYNNPQILVDVSPAGYTRRREYVWTILQAIVFTYQLQGEYATVSHRLSDLSATIRQDSLLAIESIQTFAELDFLFPEIIRIHDHDLQALHLWQAQIDWMEALPAEDIKLLNSSELQPVDLASSVPESLIAPPPEQIQYEEYQQKSHFSALRDQLRLSMAPDLRKEYAVYISQQASVEGLYALSEQNLQCASNFTIANLYSYLNQPSRVNLSSMNLFALVADPGCPLNPPILGDFEWEILG
ncbi:hypothetical protein [Phormidesmis priestleyi]